MPRHPHLPSHLLLRRPLFCAAGRGEKCPRIVPERSRSQNLGSLDRENHPRIGGADTHGRRSVTRPPGKPYLSASQIRLRVHALAQSIRKAYRKRPLTIIALLKGSVFFVVDLLRHLDPDTEVEFWNISSYQGTRSTGKVRGLQHCRGNLRGRDVLLVDDILDSGLTLHRTCAHVKKLGARSVAICVLLSKKRRRVRSVHARWVGFPIRNEFVVGYGLDLDQRYRALPSIRTLPQGS
ncbi:MAG: hypoxanthine phosphoribosyltransferase [Verrucomicrobia bacterium]|nr:hypoxanthine phosphoribosyltransferase [Pseudomonadota bacterium]NBS06520.1 hypoxanthine phosphoribosyltransferase [Verrucomicrobiota bacterium]NBS49166.1 hypoxanthine phosphoribosyltransferase [Verrucomicrobiota bacterium]NBS78563.1 hypoxanthine phosphoribosyltransferase [bacterium]NBY66347.1 hypoxanthine phosphoribosyltransferase [Verrucomicrobiota bacterium]